MTNSISVSADHLKEIVDSVLTVSMLDKQQQMTLDKQTFDLREVINKVRLMRLVIPSSTSSMYLIELTD